MSRKDRDDELAREMRAHLEMEVDELRDEGLAAEQARVAAMRAFGSQTLAMEQTRSAWPLARVDVLWKNIRFAARRAIRTPLFALTVTLVIALAVGVSTALFSLIDVVFLKPLPYPEPERLGIIELQFEASNGVSRDQSSVKGAEWEMVRDHATLFRPAVFSDWSGGVNSAAGDRAFFIKQQRVGHDFFPVLGVSPASGHTFAKEDDVDGAPPVVVISDSLRRKLYGDRMDVAGETLMLRGEPHRIMGTMPAGFNSGMAAEVWTPLKASPKGAGAGSNFRIMMRLKPGVTFAAAQGELDAISQELPRPQAQPNGVTLRPRFRVKPLQEGRSQDLRVALVVLLGAVALVLVIGAVNVGGLLLARQSGRTAELATRVALGASRRQVFGEVLLDSLVVVAAGGLAAIPVAYGALTGLQALVGDMFFVTGAAGIDLRALGIAAALTLSAGLVAGALPAMQSIRQSPRDAYAGASRAVAGRGRRIPMGLLVAAQVALVVPLLIGSGLLGRTFLKLWNLEPGFDVNNVVTARFSLEDARYATPEKVERLLMDGLARIQSQPGVEAAAAGLTVPFERQLNSGIRLGAQAAQGERYMMSNHVYITPGYFDAFRIPVLRGRKFTESDNHTAPKVAIVNEEFVRRYLDGRPALGEYFRVGSGDALSIVGVVANTQQARSFGDGGPMMSLPLFYVPVSQTEKGFLNLVHTWFSPAWIVRSSLPPDVLAAQLEKMMRELDPMLPLSKFSTPAQTKSQTLGLQRVMLTLLAVLSGLGLMLCVLGIYGLVSSSVAERTREIGIRLALGATVPGVVGNAMRPGLLWALGGVALGAPLIYLGRELLTKMVYGVTALDPLTYGAITGVLLTAVCAASLLPALALSRLDPAITLRDE